MLLCGDDHDLAIFLYDLRSVECSCYVPHHYQKVRYSKTMSLIGHDDMVDDEVHSLCVP
jgi:hypothetical protein